MTLDELILDLQRIRYSEGNVPVFLQSDDGRGHLVLQGLNKPLIVEAPTQNYVVLKPEV